MTPAPSSSPRLPARFQWSDQGVVMRPKATPERPIVSVKDPTVVRYHDEYLVYATTADTSGRWSLMYTHFSDFADADTAPWYHLSDNPAIGSGYLAAPQLFYFTPKDTWFLIYQQQPPAYSTNDDPTRPENWTAPTNFIDVEPAVVTENKGSYEWIDYWIICDSATCYLFFSDDNGTLYRAQTTVADFPNGFGDTVVVMKTTNRYDLFEACNVYRVAGTDQYLLIVEAIDPAGRRYFRSWTATSLTGSWTALADTQDNPFAGIANVAFPHGQWTTDISHGEMIRAGYDETMQINPDRLRYLYQGRDPRSDGEYSQLPYQLGLLTQTNTVE